MNKANFPVHEALQPFAEKLNAIYYTEIDALCGMAKKHAKKLGELEPHQATSSYITLCSRLIDEVQRYVRNKREHFLPYVASLSEKADDGHDCRKCGNSISCNAEHELQLTELKQAHMQIKDILNRLQMVSLPLYSETIYPDVYRVLRNNMALLESSLADLFLLEEAYLIPKVIEAQTNIHARNK